MTFEPEIDIMPHKELLEPHGKTVTKNMNNLNIQGVNDVRIGKRVSMHIEASTKQEARSKVEAACKKLLLTVITETFTYELISN